MRLRTVAGLIEALGCVQNTTFAHSARALSGPNHTVRLNYFSSRNRINRSVLKVTLHFIQHGKPEKVIATAIYRRSSRNHTITPSQHLPMPAACFCSPSQLL